MTVGFGAAVAMWGVCYFSRLPAVLLPSPILLFLLLGCLVGAGVTLGRYAGLGWLHGALAGITCPGLGIYGGDSDVLHHGERLSRVLPAFELRIYPGCTHSVLWERTEELKTGAVAWLGGQISRCEEA